MRRELSELLQDGKLLNDLSLAIDGRDCMIADEDGDILVECELTEEEYRVLLPLACRIDGENI